MYVYVLSDNSSGNIFKPFLNLNKACQQILNDIGIHLADATEKDLYLNKFLSETSKNLELKISEANCDKLSLEEINNIIGSYEQYLNLKFIGRKSHCHYIKEVELVPDYLKPENL